MDLKGLTKYEKVRILGTRAVQLSHGAQPTVEVGKLTDPLKIAQKELDEGTMPLIVERNLPNGKKIIVDCTGKIISRD